MRKLCLMIAGLLLCSLPSRAQAPTNAGSAHGQNVGGGKVTSLPASTGTADGGIGVDVTSGQYLMVYMTGPWGISWANPTDSAGNTITLKSSTFYSGGGSGGTQNYSMEWAVGPVTRSLTSDVVTCHNPTYAVNNITCLVFVVGGGSGTWYPDVGNTTGAFSSAPQSGTSATLGTNTITTDANNEFIACGSILSGQVPVSFAAGSIGSNAATRGPVSGGSRGLSGAEYYIASSVQTGVGASMTFGSSAVGSGMSCFSVSSGPLNPPFLTVNAASTRGSISPNVYGTNGWGNTSSQYTTFAAAVKMPFVRQGGDGATRFNWNLVSNCDGVDYWFVCQGTDNPDTMIRGYRRAYSGVNILITIPIFPQISNVTPPAQICSYPAALYPTQTVYNTVAGVSCGNGCTAGAGCTLQDTNLSLNMRPNSTALQGNWLDHLIHTYGNCAGGGVCFYQLDNEPNGWNNIPRDGLGTSPAPNYSTIESYGETYANLIHRKDSTAQIAGPSDYLYYGWTQNCDQCGTKNCPGLAGDSCPPYAFQWWLYKMHADSIPISQFDEHWYCQGGLDATQLQAPRELWDPTYNDGNGPFRDPIQMIPRFKTAVASYYPGLAITVSEWGCEANRNYIVDALTNADILGVFGYQGVAYADHFFTIVGTMHDNQHHPQLQYAWDMFLNYDGAGGRFGDTSVSSTSTEPTQATLTVYGAKRTSDGALTVMVINKTLSAVNTTLTVNGFTPQSTVKTYMMASSNLAVPTTMPTITRSATTASTVASGYSYPPYSATLLVFAPARPNTSAVSPGHVP